MNPFTAHPKSKSLSESRDYSTASSLGHVTALALGVQVLRVLVSSNGTRRRINPRINRLLGNDWRPASGWLLFCHFADGRWLGTHFGHHIAREFLATVISDINQLIWMPSTVRRCHVMGGRPFHSPSSHGNTCQHFHTSAQCKQTEKKLFIHGFLFESGTMICIQTGADSNEKNDQSVWNLTEFQIVLYHSIALGKLYTFPFERRPIRQRTWLRNHENSI